MTAPPARPHIYTPRQLASNFAPARANSWSWDAEDAWDSGSDNESAPATGARPIPVKTPARGAKDAAFSYTHVSAPSPSSYPPRPTAEKQSQSQSRSRTRGLRSRGSRLSAGIVNCWGFATGSNGIVLEEVGAYGSLRGGFPDSEGPMWNMF